MKPKISLIGPSHRTWLWKSFYESIITNLDFEVIFVTDKKPKICEIPGADDTNTLIADDNITMRTGYHNFIWIYSTVKPAQCFEIAYRNCIGDFIIWTGDDFIYSPYALDQVYAMYKSFHDEKVMISFTIIEDGEIKTTQHVVPWDPTIQLTTSALINKKTIESVGGLADINFISGLWDGDLMMRIYATGGKVHVCPGAFAYEPHCQFHKLEHNLADSHQEELTYFTELWSKLMFTGVRETLKERSKPLQGYSNENILKVSQGNKGKWS